MKLPTFEVVSKTNIDLSPINMGNQYCGLFRCPLNEASAMLPAFEELFNSVPVTDPENWEVDLKIHMLMQDQYPCIPNWHCDNVPRIDGQTDYSGINKEAPKMLLWLSGQPTTEFLVQEEEMRGVPLSHADVADWIEQTKVETTRIPAQTWVAMSQNTPHRGTVAVENTWRVFLRVTHKSIAPARPVNSVIRRHCQVYLDSAKFSW